MNVLIAGAGAVGGVLCARLTESGHAPFLLARGTHLQTIRERGLEIRTPKGSKTISVRADDAAPPGESFDLVVVAVKSYDNEALAGQIAPAVGDGTRILSLQNGIGNEEFYGERFGLERVLGGVTYVVSERVQPGVLLQNKPLELLIGDFPRGTSAGTGHLANHWNGPLVSCTARDAIVEDLWEKALANAVFNSLQAVHGCRLFDFLDGEKQREAEAAMKEVEAVMRALQIPVRPEARDRAWTFCKKYPDFKCSTLQDLERGNPMERDVLNGAVIRAAKQFRIPTPIHEQILEQLQKREAEKICRK